MNNGTFKNGRVKRTTGQRKFLASELTEGKKQEIKVWLTRGMSKYGAPRNSDHVKEKVEHGELTLDYDVITKTIDNCMSAIIEYNETLDCGKLSHRVLLRDNTQHEPVLVNGEVVECNLCVVIDIDHFSIVTAYWNAVGDNHASLDYSRYQA